ncbi:MAG: hypothetical protein JRH20_18325 [Deltaproteobacteria bacterium]|nr:hypothetical protein [Deltaproteobacteria bacterium]
MEKNELMQRTQGLMVFLGSLANGLESVMGRGSESLCFRSGSVSGKDWDVSKYVSTDPLEAIEGTRQLMLDHQIDWPYDLYKKEGESDYVQTDEDGQTEIRLVFRNCLVRCTLFRYGFPQEMSLCQTNHGLFSGLFARIHGTTHTRLAIVHSGENACLLALQYRQKKGSV